MMLVEVAEDTTNYITLLGGPVITGAILIVVAIIQSIRAKRSNTDVVDVSKREATVHEFDVMRQGFLDSIAELRKAREEDKEEFNTKLAEMEQRLNAQGEQISTMQDERGEMLDHMSSLEGMIPVPPGAPKRPQWRYTGLTRL